MKYIFYEVHVLYTLTLKACSLLFCFSIILPVIMYTYNVVNYVIVVDTELGQLQKFRFSGILTFLDTQ